jgi:DNA-binding transcriptional MerR regulator
MSVDKKGEVNDPFQAFRVLTDDVPSGFQEIANKDEPAVEDKVAAPVTSDPAAFMQNVDDDVDEKPKSRKSTTKSEPEEEEAPKDLFDDVKGEDLKHPDFRESNQQTVDDDGPLKYFVEDLVSEGVISEAPEEFPTDYGEVKDLIKSEVDRGVEKYKESLNPNAKRLLDYIDAGGDVSNYVDVHREPDYSNVNMEILEQDDMSQKFIVQKWLEREGYSPEEIDEVITDYEDTGLLHKQSVRSLKRLQKVQEKERSELVEQARIDSQKAQEEAQQRLQELKTSITDSEDIAGFVPSKSIREKFYKFITDRDPKTGLTGMEQAAQSMESQIRMAWYFFNDFDMSKYKSKVKGEVSSEFMRKLERGSVGSKGSRKRNKRGNTTSDFSAFEQLL